MGLALVPRGVRALADQLNAYYRVLRGVDPDSVYLRLNSGGSFEVRHSATNAAVFTVNDAGVGLVVDTGDLSNGSVTLAKLAPNSVDSSKIVDGSIMDADINSAANINASKLLAGSVTGGVGGQIAPNTVASSNILDGTIVDADIAGAAAIAVAKLGHVGANNVLKSTGTQNVGGQVVNADVAAGAAIAYSKLNLASSIASADIVDGTLTNVDINAAAAIAVTKLAHVGANNVLKSTGAANVGGQVVNADVAAGAAIAYSKLNLAGSISSADILDGTIVNGDVNAAAAIALAKLAPGSSGVLKSNGTAITAGNLIVTGDMGVNTINGDRITDATITGAKISGGAPPPNGIGVADAFKAYATSAAGTTVSLQQIVTAHIATGGQIGKLQLSYVLGADAANAAIAANTSYDVIAAQTFSVDDANSTVMVSVRGAGLMISSATTMMTVTAVIDGSILVKLGGATSNGAGIFSLLSLSGCGFVTGLSAGSHNVKLQVSCNAVASTGYFVRPTAVPYEHCAMQVFEVKR